MRKQDHLRCPQPGAPDLSIQKPIGMKDMTPPGRRALFKPRPTAGLKAGYERLERDRLRLTLLRSPIMVQLAV
jgi:hypothetical protein